MINQPATVSCELIELFQHDAVGATLLAIAEQEQWEWHRFLEDLTVLTWKRNHDLFRENQWLQLRCPPRPIEIRVSEDELERIQECWEETFQPSRHPAMICLDPGPPFEYFSPNGSPSRSGRSDSDRGRQDPPAGSDTSGT